MIALGVSYIGDRAVGKTHLAMELANPNGNYVKVISPDYENLKGLLYDENLSGMRPTGSIIPGAIYAQLLEVQVELPTGQKKITLDWLDTPGEIWRKSWQENNPAEWKKFLDTITHSEGILLILPPYREIINPNQAEPNDFITKQQWCHRFNRWIDFYRQECPKIRHLIICFNKADLFCQDLKREAAKLAYIPHRSRMTWQQRDNYVFQKYFRPIHPQIKTLNKIIQGLSVRCFITTIKNRELLELPWIYLGSFLAK